MTQILQNLTALFGSLALLAIVVGGLALMFSPSHGRTILKNTAIAVAIFVIARILIGGFITAAGDAMRQGNLRGVLVATAFGAIGFVIVGAAFVYVVNPQMAKTVIKRAALATVALLLLPTLASELFGNAGSISLLIVIAIASLTAFIIRERRPKRPERKRVGAPERTPLLPRGEEWE